MNIQKSFDDSSTGVLYVVPTPIGNLEDVTYRALKTLETVSIIAAEDTRHTKKLLNHFDISTSLISYHEHSKQTRAEQLLERLQSGDSIAVVSDAGMPAISDPGYELVEAAIERDLAVVVLPGANAALCALVGSGLSAREFYFFGFLPRKRKDKLAALTELKHVPATLLFYESPYRIKDTLKAVREELGDRQVAIARELTKRFEEYVRGTTEELLEWTGQQELKGEFCLVVAGNNQLEEQATWLWWSRLSVIEHVNHYMDADAVSSKTAIKQVALDREMSKRDVYQLFHVGE